MDLPVTPPVVPMLARLGERIPVGEDWVYEPKLDGFRAVVYKDGSFVQVASRNAKDLTEFFPDVVSALRSAAPTRCVLDGELVAVRDGCLSFEALQERLATRAVGEGEASFV